MNVLLKGLSKDQAKEIKLYEMMGEWLILFGKGFRLSKGLNKKDKARLRRLTDSILAYKDAQRSMKK